MFKTKYRKVMDILDEEIDDARFKFNLSHDAFMRDLEDPDISETLRKSGEELMLEYRRQLNVLCCLRRRIKEELGE